MRLPRPNEAIHLLPRHERDSVVDPRNIPALIMDHRSKQAGALAALRRDCASLRYLKNQSIEQSQSQDTTADLPSCPVCLMEFNVDDRAVLKCGHSLHVKCIDEILRRSGGSTTIRCPMKCINTTRKSEILIAIQPTSVQRTTLPASLPTFQKPLQIHCLWSLLYGLF